MGNMTQSDLFKNLTTKNTDYFEAAKFRLTFFFYFLLFAKYAELQKLNNNNLVLVLVHVR